MEISGKNNGETILASYPRFYRRNGKSRRRPKRRGNKWVARFSKYSRLISLPLRIARRSCTNWHTRRLRRCSRQLGKVAFERLRMTATSATGRKYGRKEMNEEVVRRGVSTREISNCTRWMKQVFREMQRINR